MKISLYLDSEKLRARLAMRLKELNKTPRGASIEAGLGASTIRNILNGSSLAPRVDTIAALAKVLQVSPMWFTEESVVHPEDRVEGDKLKFNLDPFFTGAPKVDNKGDPLAGMIPLFVPYVAKNVWGVQPPRAYTDRPIELKDTPNVYAMFVRGALMEPVYKEGDIIIVNPHLPIRAGEDYLFYYSKALTEGHDGILVIGRLLQETDDEYQYRQYGSEPGLFTITKTEADRVHGIAGKKLRET